MECNRDEAIRAKFIAEQKFAMQDFVGAKKFILKAQQLYPPLEGATQMLAVLDVHMAAQVKVGINECDWYGILQVEPLSDDSTIKKQYRKLALLLHPDKNQSLGAEAAFKLVGEAFGVLSDKTKRYVHDSKRGGEPKVAQMASHASGSSSNPAYQAQYQAAAQATPAATGAQAPHSSLTFWTACPLCRMQYQYMRTYLGFNLLCQKCHKPFQANDINAPAANGASSFSWNNGPFPAGPVPPVPRRAGTFNFQAWSQNGGVAPGSVAGNGHARAPGGAHTSGVGNNHSGAGARTSPAAAAAAANLVQEAYERAQRERIQRERVAAEKELRRREKEKEKLLRQQKEKLLRQQEKEALKKARECAKTQEALQRLTRKREEAIEKETRRRAAMESGMRKRRKRRKKDDDDDDEDEDEDELERSNSGYGSQADLTRKSSRHRRNVANEPDGELSDDDDFAVFPGAKKLRTTANGGDIGHGSGMERGKSMMDEVDDVEEIWGDGLSFDNKAGPVRDHRAKDPLQDQLAERFRQELAKKFGRANRQSTQMPGAHMEDQRRNASIASGDAQSVQHMGISSVSNGKGDQKNGAPNADRPKNNGEVNGAGEEGTSEGESEENGLVVPDPDFHDFDADRTEVHVKKNQFWAVFDEVDGMPRFYCLINRVTRAPFTVEGVWLEPIHPLKETFHWLNDRKLSIGTGEFKLGDEVDFDSINLFSHQMPIKRQTRGFEVYPKRLEVWAIYRDYDKEVTSTDADGNVKLRYDFVLILSDFSAFTGQGRVIGLQKLKGYKTLWVQHGDAYGLTVKYDLHRFSHRVPALSVTEKDVQGVPEGCLELDPASTPADTINSGET